MNPTLLRIYAQDFGIPAKHMHARLSTYGPRNKGQDSALEKAWAFVDNFRDHYVSRHRELSDYPQDADAIGRGLLLVGPPGTGKTTLAVSIMLELIHQYPDLIADENGRREDRTLRFMPMARFVQLKQESYRDDSDGDLELQFTSSAVLTVLDDVGKEYRTTSGFAQNQFDLLLRQRFYDALPTIVTTNVPAPEWGTLYGESMQSFINEAFDIVSVIGEDRRR